jgi:hypothetical protein
MGGGGQMVGGGGAVVVASLGLLCSACFIQLALLGLHWVQAADADLKIKLTLIRLQSYKVPEIKILV